MLRTASAAKPTPISLPLLTAQHYADIVRRLFGMAQDWQPPAALAYALRCLEGPPCLLLLFLWALQASGTAVTEKEIFATKVDCELLSAKLQTLSWAQPAAALHRCLHALENGRLMTFTANIHPHNQRLDLFHNIAALVLLSQPVPLDALLAPGVTVNDVIAAGFALAQPSKDDMFVLCWPRMYIWALSKVRLAVAFDICSSPRRSGVIPVSMACPFQRLTVQRPRHHAWLRRTRGATTRTLTSSYSAFASLRCSSVRV